MNIGFMDFDWAHAVLGPLGEYSLDIMGFLENAEPINDTNSSCMAVPEALQPPPPQGRKGNKADRVDHLQGSDEGPPRAREAVDRVPQGTSKGSTPGADLAVATSKGKTKGKSKHKGQKSDVKQTEVKKVASDPMPQSRLPLRDEISRRGVRRLMRSCTSNECGRRCKKYHLAQRVFGSPAAKIGAQKNKKYYLRCRGFLLACWSTRDGVPVLNLYYQRMKIQQATSDGRTKAKAVLPENAKSSRPPATAIPVIKLYQSTKNPSRPPGTSVPVLELCYQRTKIHPGPPQHR